MYHLAITTIREAWQAAVQGIAKSQIGLSNWTLRLNTKGQQVSSAPYTTG